MIDVAEFLIKNYYKKADKPVPVKILLVKALEVHREKVIVLYQDRKISGVAIFITINDSIYSDIENYDLNDVRVLTDMLSRTGNNIHFILVAGSGVKEILRGLRLIKKKFNPKTVSWWSPDQRKIHKYNCQRREKCLLSHSQQQ